MERVKEKVKEKSNGNGRRGNPLRPRDIAEVGIAVALAIALGLVRVFKMPQGGSVSLDMVPIFYLAFRRGPGLGILAGALLGFGKLLIEPYVIHPVQLLMDYPLPFAVLGLAGFFANRPWIGVTAGSAARFLMHFLSGVIFFASYAPEGQSPALYSAIYNASYLVPELIISAIIMEYLVRAGGIRVGRNLRGH